MAALTPAFADDLPPLGELIADDPFWRYPSATTAGGVTHLRVWLTGSPKPGHLAVVTETGHTGSGTESAGHIWAELARRYGPSAGMLEHNSVPKFGEAVETLDLVRAAPTAACTGPGSGRPQGTIHVTPSLNCGWQLRAPDRQPASELVRLVRRRGRRIPGVPDRGTPGRHTGKRNAVTFRWPSRGG